MVTKNTALGLFRFVAFSAAGKGSNEVDFNSEYMSQHDNSKVIYWAEICFVNDFTAEGDFNCTV